MGVEAALGLQGFGIGASSVGAFYTAKGQKSALDTQAYLDELNAKTATQNAASAMLSGQREEQRTKLNTAQIKSSQKAALAANGVDLSSDSAVAVLTSTDVIGETNAATVAANAMRDAFGYQTQALNFENRARGAKATSSGINPFVSAGTSLISGAGSVAQSWYTLKRVGAFDKQVNSKYGPQNDVVARTFGQHNLVSDALY